VAVEGNPIAGDRFFSAGDCSGCHVVNGVGGRQGPDLSNIGARRTPVQLMSDLVDPDERVQPRWWTMRVTHLDGTRIEGLRMNEGTYSLRILDAEDNLWSLEKKDLREIERIEASSMPSYSGLSETQLNDLVAYLYGLTGEDP
jgi:putative heme-binding domain-containing protein